MSSEDAARGIELSPDDLSPEALRGLVEEFVTRDGTDYGAVERRPRAMGLPHPSEFRR